MNYSHVQLNTVPNPLDFNPEPISAASIAQVHDAILKSNGKKVAVKVQHRWLKEQCAGDLKIFSFLVDIGEWLFPEFKYRVKTTKDHLKFQWLPEEMKKYIPMELNFVQEADHTEQTGEYFKDDPTVEVPHIYREFSNV